MKKYVGLIIQALAICITIGLWLMAKDRVNFGQTTLTYLSQLAAVCGFVVIAINLSLATRLRIVERLFGGMDKAYLLHHFWGGIGFCLILSHPILLAINFLTKGLSVRQYVIPGQDLGYSLGIIGIYLMVLAFVFMVGIKLPYQRWLVTHRLLAVGFLVGSVHMAIIPSDVAVFLPLRVWLITWAGIGNLAAGYRLLLYKRFGPQKKLQVSKIDKTGDIVSILLKPVGEQVKYQPGQFGYLVFDNSDLGKEAHPYSFASYGQKEIRLAIKVLGDYTAKLTNLKLGQEAVMYGPYGQFGKRYVEENREMVWIGAGIGITPFLSMLDYELARPGTKKIQLFYVYGKREEGVFEQEIKTKADQTKTVTAYFWCSEHKGRITLDQIQEKIGDLKQKTFMICGPQAMMTNFKNQLLKARVNEKEIIFENFNLV